MRSWIALTYSDEVPPRFNVRTQKSPADMVDFLNAIKRECASA
jgi:hypothetical protein